MTNRIRSLTALVLSLHVLMAPAQTVAAAQTAPTMQACTNPIPPTWPGTNCLTSSFVPLTVATVTVNSGTEAAPNWAHTLTGYATTAKVIACPIGAVLSADSKSCTDSTGKDAAAAVTISSLATFSIVPPPTVTLKDYPVSWPAVVSNADGTKITDLTGYTIEHSNLTAGPWDKLTTTAAAVLTYTLNAPTNLQQCVRVTTVSQHGNSDPSPAACQAAVVSPPAKPATPTAPTIGAPH
jgi:hypothetical protein